MYNSVFIGTSALVGKGMELYAVGLQFEPRLTAGCVCTAAAPLLCGLGCRSQTAEIEKAAACKRPAGARVVSFSHEYRRQVPPPESPPAAGSTPARGLRRVRGEERRYIGLYVLRLRGPDDARSRA